MAEDCNNKYKFKIIKICKKRYYKIKNLCLYL